MKPAQRISSPRIISDMLRVSHLLAAKEIDMERLCYLVSDQEWNEIIEYISHFSQQKEVDIGIETMRFTGLEVIKRSVIVNRARTEPQSGSGI